MARGEREGGGRRRRGGVRPARHRALQARGVEAMVVPPRDVVRLGSESRRTTITHAGTGGGDVLATCMFRQSYMVTD